MINTLAIRYNYMTALKKIRVRVMVLSITFNNTSATFVYTGGQFYCTRKLSYDENPTDLTQVYLFIATALNKHYFYIWMDKVSLGQQNKYLSSFLSFFKEGAEFQSAYIFLYIMVFFMLKFSMILGEG